MALKLPGEGKAGSLAFLAPAWCQARREWRQVLPQPSSAGRSSQGMPVLRTNRMPVRLLRSSKGLRPGKRKRRAGGGGSKGCCHPTASCGGKSRHRVTSLVGGRASMSAAASARLQEPLRPRPIPLDLRQALFRGAAARRSCDRSPVVGRVRPTEYLVGSPPTNADVPEPPHRG